MTRWKWALPTAAAVTLAICALPARALASTTQQSILMDDDQLIYVSQQHQTQALEQIASLGVDVVKVSMVWQLVAPDPYSSQRPANFDATNPADYPPGAWTRYDNLVETAQRLGMKVYFLLIGPAPLWAIPPSHRTKEGPSLGWAPDPTDYGQFVQAVGERYSGAYVDPPAPSADSSGLSVDGITVPGTSASQAAASDPATAIPRVDYWGIWNEPNERSWLDPWYQKVPGHGRELLQPSLYRGLIDAAWGGLQASSHGTDTIMIGETANEGTIEPEPFVRDLYCVGSKLRPLRGNAAASVGCPTSPDPSQFVSQNPALFEASYAHHPYAFDVAPNKPYPHKYYVTLDNLSSLERLLVRTRAAYGRHSSGGVPLYLTEWGYETNPPNPYVHTSLADQAAWLNEGEYMTWKDPWVRALTQFELVDSPPITKNRRGSRLYWSSFQTGLEYQNGKPKPSLDAFQVPIWLPVARHGRSVTVWGQLRAADHLTTQYGVIEFEPKGSSSWKELTEVETNSSEGFLVAHVSIPSAGKVRLGWLDPSGIVYYSRPAPVS